MRNHALLFAALMCVVAFGGARQTAAQHPGLTERVWETATRYDYDRLSEGRQNWRRWTVSLKRETSHGTLMATVIRQQRFGTTDGGLQIDAWPDLWAGAYGHVKAGLSPTADVRPQGTLQSGVFQSVGAWELSGRYSWRRYRSEDVHQFGPGLGRYVGSWYLRTRTTLGPRPDTWAVAQRIGARRFYGPASSLSYVDVEGGLGRSVEPINSRSEILVTRTFFVSVRLRHFLTSGVGVTAAVRYSDDEVFQHTGGTLGVFAQW